MRPLLISFASQGREDYLKMSENLYRSIKDHWKHDYVMYTMDSGRTQFEGIKLELLTELPQPANWNCSPHKVIPYQFKLGMIDLARDRGYTHIIWVDSSITLAKDPMPLLLQSNRGVMTFHNLGFELKDFISDDCMNKLNASYQEIDYCPQVWGGCFGLDLTKRKPNIILDELIKLSQEGAFNDGYSNRQNFVAHRHDQAVMSVIFHRHGVLPYNYGHIVANAHSDTKEYGDYYTFCYGKTY